jgi:hypothetical protein
MRTIVLVEGVTDELALTLAARRSGRDLKAEGVTVVPINGAHAISRFLRQLAAEKPGAKLAGLYDEGEEEVIRAALERVGYGPNFDRSQLEGVGFFACIADLEDELISGRRRNQPINAHRARGRRAAVAYVPEPARVARPPSGSTIPPLHPERVGAQQPIYPGHRRDDRSIPAASAFTTAPGLR